MICSGIITGCDLLNGDKQEITVDTGSSVRPCRIDMTGVQGFALVENTPNTKADTNGDGVDDDIYTTVKTSPYSLYTIDKNGELHVSIFYFEAVPSEDGKDNNAPNDETLKKLAGVLQIVPSLVTDLGKYILFSDCQYQIIDSDINNEVRAICEAFVIKNMWGHRVYMIRKSDGALFDLSGQPIFSYYAYGTGGGGWWFYNLYLDNYDPTTGFGERWAHIPSFTYTTSAKDNLFVRGWDPNVISKIEDNGPAVTVTQITHDYKNFSRVRNFAVDENENLYEFFGYGQRLDQKNAQIDIYYANGGFNVYEFTPTMSYIKPELLDIVTDESGISYVFLCSFCQMDNNGVMENSLWLQSAKMVDGQVYPIKEDILKSDWNSTMFNDQPNYHYLGYNNGCFNWYLPLLHYKNDEPNNKPVQNYSNEILSYNISTGTWTLKKISSNLMSILSANYDVFVNGKTSYGANINGKEIEVTEIDIVSETSRKYTISVDIPDIVSPSFNVRMIQDVPYLTIAGRNTVNGAGVSVTINLINGDNNSTFSSDNRTVVSFFRIN